MSRQVWHELYAVAPAAGTLFNTYTAAKSVLPAGSNYSLQPNYFNAPGVMLKMTVIGAESHRVTGPDTMTFQVELGGSVIAFTSGALNLTTTAHTTIPFIWECWLTCLTIGAGTAATLKGQSIVRGQGFAMAASLADGVANTGYAMGPNTAPAAGTGFDSTIAQSVDFWVAQSVSNAANGIQVHQYMLESFN